MPFSVAGVPPLQRFYPGLVIGNGYALLAPARTPQAVVAQLHAGTRRALNDGDVREFLLINGITAVGGAPDAPGAALQSDMDRFAGKMRRGELRLQ